MSTPLAILQPNNSRTFICGTTGSGKTTFAAFLLGQSNLGKPWVILDYKREDIFEKLIGTGKVNVQYSKFHRPKRGLEVIRPKPQVDDEAVEALLWALWGKGKCGLFVDEALHLPTRSKAMTNILAQGRSKQIQVIVCAQRPFYVSPFLISESGYFGVFELYDKRDQDRVREFVPLPKDYDNPPPHYLYWYQRGKDIKRLAPLDRPAYIVGDIVSQLPARIW